MNAVDVGIREAIVADAAALAQLASQAFHDTYRLIDDPDDIADYVRENFTPATMAAHIADPLSTMLLAQQGERLVGYAQVRRSPVPPCVQGPAPIELARLYLDKSVIGLGLGSRMMRAAQAEARRQGARTLWLSVYDRNLRAVDFYKRCGFVEVGGKEFLFGGKIYVDPVMAAPVPYLLHSS